MADAAAQQLIEQIVQEKVQAGAMFTAYDITLEARQRGGNVRHNEARDIVHECFQRGQMGAGYARSQIDVGAPVKPLLYHRFADDPSTYQSPGAAPPPGQKPQGVIARVISAVFGKTQRSPSATPTPPQKPVPPRTTSASGPPKQRPSQTIGLDAAQYLPITRDELKQEASRDRWFGNVFFGRRDLIPPANDPRTSLIDRALVTNGLLSPEELATIHKVGAEMDQLRPDYSVMRHQTALAGQAAVEADREERAKLKQQKKEEAARKKAERIAAIAQRKATDIIFLGRGVSSRLWDRRSDAARLAAKELPVLATASELATALGLTIPELRWLAFHTEVASRVHYVQFTVPKRSGGERTLSAPHRKLAAAQEWILTNILNRLPVENSAHGFTAGRSILTNAEAHVGKQVLVNMDLENFFPSITFPRVRSVFQRLGYSPAVATILALLCTECPRREVNYEGKPYFVATAPRGLPQGACTSPALSNQVARRLDKRLQGLAQKFELSYTRYADDLSFSGHGSLAERIGYIMARVRHIAEDEGFVVNAKKSRVLRRSTAQLVTGLVVNDRPGVPRETVRKVRAILHRARREGLAAQNREAHPNFNAWLSGMIAYIAMSRPEVGARLRAELEELLAK